MKNSKKGFTLIELLVVIAIIGLLTSIALASLNSARNKAADATIKQNLAQIRAQAQIVYDNSGSAASYVDTFGVGNVGQKIFDAAVAASGCSNPNCYFGEDDDTISPSSWMAAVKIKTDTSKAWCVDYLGSSKIISSYILDNLGDPPYSCP